MDKITLGKAQTGYLITHTDGRNILIQTDWDYPGIASYFGWSMRDTQVMQAHYYGVLCQHSSTDGTVACAECGLTPTTFIRDAAEYLDQHLGESVDDPGYFETL